MAHDAEARFRESVEAVRIGYLIARSKKALREWQRHQRKSGPRRQVGLTGEALERTMSGILLAHPEFVRGVPRPRHMQPRGLWAAEAAAKRKSKPKGKG